MRWHVNGFKYREISYIYSAGYFIYFEYLQYLSEWARHSLYEILAVGFNWKRYCRSKYEIETTSWITCFSSRFSKQNIRMTNWFLFFSFGKWDEKKNIIEFHDDLGQSEANFIQSNQSRNISHQMQLCQSINIGDRIR